MPEKRIEVCKLKAKDIKTGFGNPRKISKKKLDDLEKSFELFGDFGLFLVDEDNNIIAGNQRLKAVKNLYGPDFEITAKRLIGYTESELRAINIKDNTHAGEWDIDLLADWTSDLQIDLGVATKEKSPDARKIREMELIRYEKYDYVMIVCRNEVDYLNLLRKFDLENCKTLIVKHRRIKARAVWYDDVADIISEKQRKEDVSKEMKEVEK